MGNLRRSAAAKVQFASRGGGQGEGKARLGGGLLGWDSGTEMEICLPLLPEKEEYVGLTIAGRSFSSLPMSRETTVKLQREGGKRTDEAGTRAPMKGRFGFTAIPKP